ncbi:hypothetical protein CRE_06865 [Caenorhabditis remanei]|uniref:BTB domain-containing protein n=1 Tax=Caenorhabditis remanei TaxID=31234 RepID=E3MZN0_CAERE|nr:hypothetical protein CRE_06865 [Caenorhabditis remanei]
MSIKYTSEAYQVNRDTNVLETKTNSGITCVWSGNMNSIPYQINLTWKFDWSELKSQGVYELTGHINVISLINSFTPIKIDVQLTENNQEITKDFNGVVPVFNYEYFLTPHYTPIFEKPSYKDMFLPSDQNDTILVVDGKKFHVSKAFLSYHSEYFRALFSSNFKEGQMDEIPIGEVSYEDFALLLSTFYPNPVFPNDSTVEKILEMARRFLVSSAMSCAEHHLMYISRIIRERMLWLADEYGMPKLLEKCIHGLDTTYKVENLKQSEEFEKLSDETKLRVADQISKLSHI